MIVGQPAVAIQGSRGDLIMGMLTAPVFGRVATWMARLPAPRFTVPLLFVWPDDDRFLAPAAGKPSAG